MRTTNIWIILNEETLEIVKLDNGEPAKFKTRFEADEFASERLEMWETVNSHFVHKFINHKPNN